MSYSDQTIRDFVDFLQANSKASTQQLADKWRGGVKKKTIWDLKSMARNKGYELPEDNSEESTTPPEIVEKVQQIDDEVVPEAAIKRREVSIQKIDELAAKMAETVNDLDPEKDEINYRIKEKDWFALLGLSDLHWGHKNTSYEFINRLFNSLTKYNNLYGFVNGDIIENWVRAAPESGGWEEVIEPKYQRKVARAKLSQVAHKILFMIEGNHEWRSAKQGEESMIESLAEEFEIPYLGHGGRINLNINDIKYKIHARHRFRYESSLNKTNANRRLNEVLDAHADIVCIGHKHAPEVHDHLKAGEWKLYLRYGAAMEKSEYSEMKGYPKSPMVAPIALMNARRKAIEGVKDLEFAIPFLEEES